MSRWEHAGLDCLTRRGAFDCPCGYVGVRDGHPFHGIHYTKLEKMDEYPDVHGGVTFTGVFDEIDPSIWWIGFDTAHFGDFSESRMPLWTEKMCVSETERLAEQVAKAAKSDA